jgi:shikimate dehydrogenase
LLSEDGHAWRLGVLGWPVAHSLSPAIQNAALRAAGLGGWRYQLLPAPPEAFDELVRALPGAEFRGVNVTLPHKSAALALATDPTPRAREIGAANTLTFEEDGTITADNTDAVAVTASVPIELTGASALVLGAGGSARAAVWALHHAGVAEVRIWNRTAARAQALGRELGARPVTAAAPADLLVNCTSVGLDGSGSLEGLPVSRGDLAGFRCLVDLVYARRPTGLVCAAAELGVPAVDGLEFLIAQGAESFSRFTGRPASVLAMRAALGRAPVGKVRAR